MTRRALPYAFLLPLGSILLWVCLVATPATLAYLNLQREARGAQFVTLHYTFRGVNFSDVVDRKHFLRWSIQAATRRDYQVVEAVNLPATCVEVIASHLAPSGMFVHSWRATIFPFYALPFWWFVGVGIDDLLQRRTLRWPPRIAGMLLWAVTVFLTIGVTFAMSAAERGSLIYPLWGFALWSALLAVFPIGWFALLRRFRARKPSLANLHT